VDAALGLRPHGQWSRGVRRRAAFAGAVSAGSFLAASQMLRECAGIELDPSAIERETLRTGETAFGEQKRRDAAWSRPEKPGEPAAGRGNEDVVIAADGVFTLAQRGRRGPKPRKPLEKDAAREASVEAVAAEAAGPPEAGEAQGKSFGRETKVGIVYGLSDRAKTAGGRPLLIDRRVVASSEGIERFGERLKALACRWGWRRARRVVALGDGAPWIWAWVTGFLGEGAIQILDFWHARDHLTRLGQKLFEPAGEASAWSRTQAARLRAGEVDGVIATLEDLARRRRGGAREALLAEVRYFRANRQRMRYPDYEARGLPIGSGSVESLGKCLVKNRLCGGGMRWEKAGLRAVLALRELHENDDWEAFWDQDVQRLLPAA